MGNNGGKQGGMEENGEEWGGKGEIAVIAHGMLVVEGCGRMWLRKMGGKWRKWAKYPFFKVPFSPFFRRSKIFHSAPFVKMRLPHSPTGKWEFLPLTDTHRHGGWWGCLVVLTHYSHKGFFLGGVHEPLSACTHNVDTDKAEHQLTAPCHVWRYLRWMVLSFTV